mgnify:CR=1 FL=1
MIKFGYISCLFEGPIVSTYSTVHVIRSLFLKYKCTILYFHVVRKR